MNYNDIDIFKIIYETPYNFKSNILYKLNNLTNINIISPKLKVLRIYDSKEKSYILVELDKIHEDFYEFLRKLDELNISNSYCNSNTWFNKEIPLNILEDYYKSPIRLGRKSNMYYLKLYIKKIGNIEKNKYYQFNLNYNNLNYYKQDFYPSIFIEEYKELPKNDNNYYLNNNLENNLTFENPEVDVENNNNITNLPEEDNIINSDKVNSDKVNEEANEEANDEEANDEEANDEEANEEANDEEANEEEANDEEANEEEANEEEANEEANEEEANEEANEEEANEEANEEEENEEEENEEEEVEVKEEEVKKEFTRRRKREKKKKIRYVKKNNY